MLLAAERAHGIRNGPGGCSGQDDCKLMATFGTGNPGKGFHLCTDVYICMYVCINIYIYIYIYI